jgi:heme/copper-type cytochrome/quinol oxidase subunit 3
MSALPHSGDARTPPAVARIERSRLARPNGWWGMAIFVATEATLFGTLIGTYYYLRFNNAHWPPPGVPEPKLTLPLVLTGILVATSVPMQLAVSAASRGRLVTARAALLVAVVVQAGYLGMQLHLFVHDVHEFPPSGSSYSSIYFTMLGGHHLHVGIGILLNVWLLLRTATGLTSYRLNALRATAFYWHFVNILALCVVGTQLSPRA